MFIKVRLISGFSKLLWYHVPPQWHATIQRGVLVDVPLQKRFVPALVEHVTHNKPTSLFTIKDINHLFAFPKDTNHNTFIKKLAHHYQVDYLALVARTKTFLYNKEQSIDHQIIAQNNQNNVTLTDEQHHAYQTIKPTIIQPHYQPFVLHGVTGSGKTEVYKELIIDVIDQNKSVIFLLPEVTLTLTMQKRLQSTLPTNIPIYGLHSACTAQERKTLWQQLIDETPLVLIGVHLPILFPMANLGLIIVDEEHEIGYQEKKHPKIDSKHAALIRAFIYNVPIILGSATPSLQTLYNAEKHNWPLLKLQKRFSGAFPTIKKVLLTKDKKRPYFWISSMLQSAIKQRLQQKEQTIVYLNRRGHSFFVQCKTCSFVIDCINCSVSLTLHANNNLHCHYCGYIKKMPTRCPSCKKENDFLKKGVGTQQIVTILQKLFPHAIIARADLNTTKKKKEWATTVQKFTDGTIDILVGTQTITKGYDFPGVTLIGIIWADLSIHLPVYNAVETSLQQLIQVAGRAGRHKKNSEVIIQTMTDHSALQFINEIQYLSFAQQELAKRKQVLYPPYIRFACIEVKHTNPTIVDKDACTIAQQLQTTIKKHHLTARLYGPTTPPIEKVQKIFCKTIYLKTPTWHTMLTILNTLKNTNYTSKWYFIPS